MLVSIPLYLECPLKYVTPTYSLNVHLYHSQVSQVISGLCLLYWLNMELCYKLQVSCCARADKGTCTRSIDTLPDSHTLFVCVEPGPVGAVCRHGAKHDLCSGR